MKRMSSGGLHWSQLAKRANLQPLQRPVTGSRFGVNAYPPAVGSIRRTWFRPRSLPPVGFAHHNQLEQTMSGFFYWCVTVEFYSLPLPASIHFERHCKNLLL